MILSDFNKAPVDWFTFSHFGLGIFLGSFMNIPTAAALSIGYEVIENPAKEKMKKFFPITSADTLANSTVDTLAFVAGVYVIRKARNMM